MDDPWAAGPSWTFVKPKTSSDAHGADVPSRSPTFTPPPASFDVSDPWGVPAGSKPLPGEESRPKSPIRNDAVEEPSWAGDGDGAWEESVKPPEPPESAELADINNVADERQHDVEREDWGDVSAGPAATGEEADEDGDQHGAVVQEPHEIAEADQSAPVAPTVEVDLSSPPRSPLPVMAEIPSDIPTFPTFDAEPDQPLAPTFSEAALPKSPSFRDDAFGGFSTGFASSDPWGPSADVGGGWGGAGEEVDLPRFGSGEFRADQVDDESDQEGEGEGWGRVKPPVPMSREATPVRDDGEEDWEEVQRRIRLQEQRMPREKVEGLKDRWKEVVLGLVVENLEALTEEEERALSDGVRKVEADSYEATRSLSLIPPDINIYPPVISSLVTHERHAYALSRPNSSPSTSLLTLSLARKPRRMNPLDADSPWLTRSKLGEPDAPPVEAPALSPETSGSKWSFWRKPPPLERQLTTSGGGVLEVKSPTAPSISRSSSDVKAGFGSRSASIRTDISRPASPAPSLPVSFSDNDFGPAPPNGLVDMTTASSGPGGALPAGMSTSPATTPAPAAGPSAVSRFFGRLGRNKTPVPSADGKVDNKDLELSADDFTFLSEVPSLSDPADHDVGDLLSMEPGRGEQMASLESMLSSKPAPLPAPLAPPPRSGLGSRTTSGSGSSFVPRMKAPAPRAPTDMDLLGGLEFGDAPSPTGTATPPPPPIQKSPPTGTAQLAGSIWDDFLAPAPASSAPSRSASSSTTDLGSPATLMGPPRPSASPSTQQPRPTSSGMFALSPPRAVAPLAPAASRASAAAAPPSDDFDDFGTPQNSSVAQFDDFDFGSFETPGAKRQSQSGPVPSLSPDLKTPQNKPSAQFESFNFSSFDQPPKPAIVTPAPKTQTHQPRSSLDHTPTISLMTGASASKGKRWPAPPSPGLPMLDPPPRSSPAVSSAGFPFLSPPPPPGRATPTRGMDLLGGQGGAVGGAAGAGASVPPPTQVQMQQKPLHGMLPTPTPPRAGSPLVPAGAGMKKDAASGSQGGLSSADLSFFDSL